MIKRLFGNKNHLLRRYLIFMAGVLITSLGVAVTTKAGIGMSPISAIPYSLSLLLTQLSFGEWIIVFSMAQLAVQIILLRKNCNVPELVIQGVLAFFFGSITDLHLAWLGPVVFTSYIMRLAFFIAGCFVIGLGVFLQLAGDVAMLSGDAFISVIARVSGKAYGTVKIISDSAMTVVAALICIIFMGELSGVREGSIIAAVLVGLVIKLYQRLFRGVTARLLPEDEPPEKAHS